MMVTLLPRLSRTILGGPAVEQRHAERERLRISRFDVVCSLLMSLIVLIGVSVLMLFIIWVTSQWSFPSRAIEATVKNPQGTLNPAGFELDFEPPGLEEVEG